MTKLRAGRSRGLPQRLMGLDLSTRDAEALRGVPRAEQVREEWIIRISFLLNGIFCLLGE